MMPRQLYYDPGPLAQVSQVWIVESLPAGDFRTGRRLSEEIAAILQSTAIDIPVIFRTPASSDKLMTLLDELCADILATGLNPILDIECHGNMDGLKLSDNSFLAWSEIKPKLEAINIASGFNLILLLGCCHGGYFASTTRLAERSAFCAYVAPTESLSAGSLYDGFLAFYVSLFTERDITTAMKAMRTAAPGIPSICATALGFFRLAFASYLRNWTSEKALWRRAKSLRQAKMRDQSIQDVAQMIKNRGPIEFERCRRLYFAIDVLPQNDARYALRFEDVATEGKHPDRAGEDAF
jgi:hypothetical protein